MHDAEFLPTRESLLHRLRDLRDDHSWQEFFETYSKFIYGVARKAGLSDAEAQDIVQETMISVARKMPGFVYEPKNGSFKAWLMLVTRRRITDHHRKKQFQAGGQKFLREARLETGLAENLAAKSPEDEMAMLEAEWQRTVADAAMAQIKEQLDPKHFQIFQMHVLREVPAREVATRLGVKLPEVYFAKYKVSALLRKRIRRLEKHGS